MMDESPRVLEMQRQHAQLAAARLVIVGLFVSVWFGLWLARIPYPRPFLFVLLAEAFVFSAYARGVFVLRSERQIQFAYSALLLVEIIFFTTIVYFLGGAAWFGTYACVFGVIFTTAFLDLRRGLIYTGLMAAAFVTLTLLEGTGTIPHYEYLEQGSLRYRDARYVITTDVGTVGVFFGITLFLYWVGGQLRRERDKAVAAHGDLDAARRQLERANSVLEDRVRARTQELEAAFNNFRLLFADNPQPMWVLDRASLSFLEVNEAAVRHYGYSRGEFLGMTQNDIIADGDAAPVAPPTADDAERRHRLSDGRIITVEVQAHDLNFDGRDAMLVVAQDVTARHEAQSAQARLTAIIEATPDLVSIADAEGTRLYLNAAGRRMLGVEEEHVGQTALVDGHPEWARATLESEALPAATREGSWSGELALLSPDGREIPVSQVTLAHKASSGEVEFFSTVARDISDRKRFESRLVQLANHDPLTGLFNRRRFEEELERQLAESQRYNVSGALLFIDLDQFKDVNDTRGHRAGDDLLIELAGLLRDRLRATDTVARLGGDEFAVILPHVAIEEAAGIAQELLLGMREHRFAVAGTPLTISASVGVALFPTHGSTTGELLSHADLAMYRAKEEGRNRVTLFEPEADWQAQIESRIGWQQRIRDALERDLFVLHAQPVIRVEGRGVSQYELLLRMANGDGDVVLPAEFLDTAQRSGLIQDIDRWVVRRAIKMLGEHRAAGQDVRFEVNLAATAFGDPHLLPMIQQELGRNGVDPGALILEITESAAIAQIDEAQQFMRALRAIGCGFALDDFGVGFSSFSHLKHLPVDYLKIDGGFIRQLPRSSVDQHVVKAMVGVARGMGIRTIAEFVGDEETLTLLEEYGVDFAQGYYVGRPAPLALPEERFAA